MQTLHYLHNDVMCVTSRPPTLLCKHPQLLENTILDVQLQRNKELGSPVHKQQREIIWEHPRSSSTVIILQLIQLSIT